MSQAEKMLARMRRNPRNDWTIANVETVCASFGIDCEAPPRGSHYKISHPTQVEILTIPARKPIKPAYIAELVSYIDAVAAAAPKENPVGH